MVKRGWPVLLAMTEVLPGPPDVVWELITDWEHQDDWMLEASDFVVTSDHRAGTGVEANATIKIGGIKTRDTVRVVTWEPPRRLALEHLGWVTGLGAMTLTPVAGERTHLLWTEELWPPMGVVGAVGLTLFRPLLHRAFRRDLRVLTGLVRAARG